MTCRAASPTEIERILRNVLRDVAVPKPSRSSELYAALTLSIVLVKEHLENKDPKIMHHAHAELARLERKRDALEETLEAGGA